MDKIFSGDWQQNDLVFQLHQDDFHKHSPSQKDHRKFFRLTIFGFYRNLCSTL